MDKDILIEGKNYISAARAAKKIGYASDYIGQLSRDGKIASRMVGRTWYVDFDSLLEHKRNFKLSKFKKNKKIDQPRAVHEPTVSVAALEAKPALSEIILEKASSVATIRYERDDAPRLPELSKLPRISTPVISKVFLKNTVAVFASLFIIISTSISWAEYFSPSSIVRADEKIADLFDRTQSLGNRFSIDFNRAFAPQIKIKNELTNSLSAHTHAASGYLGFISGSVNNVFTKYFGAKIVEGQSAATAIATTTEGIVVVPDDGPHGETVSKIKTSFSDEVNVNIDPDGTSGTITPVFHTGDDSENYAFIIVPVKKSK